MSSVPAVEALRRRSPEDELDPTLSEDEQSLVTEDDTPVDSVVAEKQRRLSVGSLYASWGGPPGPEGAHRLFVAYANVGLYLALNHAPLVPDVLVSLDVEHPANLDEKRGRAYLVWRFGKVPDLVLEIVSNKEGGELSTKRERYRSIGIPFYVVFDPFHKLGDETLLTFELRGGNYERVPRFFPALGIGVTLWHGEFEGITREWLRWCDAEGKPLPTGTERAEQEKQRAEQEKQRAEQEKQRAEQEKQRAEQEKQRAERLAAKLRAMGVEPDEA